MKSTGIAALAAGFISGGLFLLVAALQLGFFFMFLPTLPLFSAGLGRHSRIAFYGALAAALLIGALVNGETALAYLAAIGLPCWYLSKRAILWRGEGEARQWYPLGLAFLDFTFYAIALLALVMLLFAGEPGGLPGAFASLISEAMAGFEEQYRDAAIAVAAKWVALIVAIMYWLWALALYAHAWFTNRMLAGKQANRRPDFAVMPFDMPGSALFAIAAAGLFSLVADPSLRFFGQASLVMLMLPYFFSGAAVMHQTSKNWPSRRFFLFFVYFSIAAQFWPALGVSAIGLWQHIKRLSSIPSSSK
jgi:hypothetical protein